MKTQTKKIPVTKRIKNFAKEHKEEIILGCGMIATGLIGLVVGKKLGVSEVCHKLSGEPLMQMGDDLKLYRKLNDISGRCNYYTRFDADNDAGISHTIDDLGKIGKELLKYSEENGTTDIYDLSKDTVIEGLVVFGNVNKKG